MSPVPAEGLLGGFSGEALLPLPCGVMGDEPRERARSRDGENGGMMRLPWLASCGRPASGSASRVEFPEKSNSRRGARRARAKAGLGVATIVPRDYSSDVVTVLGAAPVGLPLMGRNYEAPRRRSRLHCTLLGVVLISSMMARGAAAHGESV